jgi:flagellar biogenesis protein FliO
MIRNNYANAPNPKHAITFAIVSVAILILPLFWSPLNDQRFTPLATTTPTTVKDLFSPTPAPQVAVAPPTAIPAVQAQATPTPHSNPVARTTPAVAPSASPPSTPAPTLASTPAPSASETPDTVAASNEPTRTDAGKFQDPTLEFSGQLRRIVLSLLVTTALIAFTLRAARKHIPALGGQKPLSFMKVLAREAISPTQSLALVQVGTKILLVGLSEQNMTTLSEFSEADLESLIPKAPEPEARTAKSVYGDVLRHYLSIVPGLGAKK